MAASSTVAASRRGGARRIVMLVIILGVIGYGGYKLYLQKQEAASTVLRGSGSIEATEISVA
ncbi:MAG: hypothetical protein ACM30E_05625, partial [Nitrososphaerales archaeon]